MIRSNSRVISREGRNTTVPVNGPRLGHLQMNKNTYASITTLTMPPQIYIYYIISCLSALCSRFPERDIRIRAGGDWGGMN